jgi:hypothetical protein
MGNTAFAQSLRKAPLVSQARTGMDRIVGTAGNPGHR